MVEWTDSLRVFEALRDLPSPLRVADMPAYVGALGFSTDGVIINTFQGTPMRHRGAQVGNFFLGEKETGPEFTDEDEEVMALFASQAAAAIVNARTHRDERRARADLEALVETSPVGVVVFDARSGRPVSFNRETRRIAESLLSAGPPDGGVAGADVLPTRRWPRGVAQRVPHRGAAANRRDVARRRDCVLGPGRAQRHRAPQRDLNPVRRGRGRLGGGHHAGPGAATGAGAVAFRIPRPGEPRVARAAHFHHGLGSDTARSIGRARPGRAPRVPIVSSTIRPRICAD